MKTTIETNLQDPEFRRHFAEEGFVVECMERVCEWMEREDVTRAELARRLGTSRANVTQMLAGRNVSLRTLAGVAHVLGGVPDFRIIGASEPSVVTHAPHLKLIDCGAWRSASIASRNRPAQYEFADDRSAPMSAAGLG